MTPQKLTTEIAAFFTSPQCAILMTMLSSKGECVKIVTDRKRSYWTNTYVLSGKGFRKMSEPSNIVKTHKSAEESMPKYTEVPPSEIALSILANNQDWQTNFAEWLPQQAAAGHTIPEPELEVV